MSVRYKTLATWASIPACSVIGKTPNLRVSICLASICKKSSSSNPRDTLPFSLSDLTSSSQCSLVPSPPPQLQLLPHLCPQPCFAPTQAVLTCGSRWCPEWFCPINSFGSVWCSTILPHRVTLPWPLGCLGTAGIRFLPSASAEPGKAPQPGETTGFLGPFLQHIILARDASSHQLSGLLMLRPVLVRDVCQEGSDTHQGRLATSPESHSWSTQGQRAPLGPEIHLSVLYLLSPSP